MGPYVSLCFFMGVNGSLYVFFRLMDFKGSLCVFIDFYEFL